MRQGARIRLLAGRLGTSRHVAPASKRCKHAPAWQAQRLEYASYRQIARRTALAAVCQLPLGCRRRRHRQSRRTSCPCRPPLASLTMAAPKKLAVIGAGVAGLLAAQQLKHEGEAARRRQCCRPPLAPASSSTVQRADCPDSVSHPIHPLAGYDVKIFEKTGNVGGVWQSNYAGYTLQVGADLWSWLGFAHAGRRVVPPPPPSEGQVVWNWTAHPSR